MFSAGRVLIKPEGEYSPLKTYEMLDYVSYNGSSYIAKKTTTGNLPTDTEYWQLSASGAQSQNVTSNFAEVEGSDIASSPHAIDDVFVNKDGKLLKATLAISIGDTIVIDTNCEPTTVEGLISYLSTQVSTLDSSNKKLNGITEIAVQTDLHTLDLGEFYKDKTSFYVTNGPEEVDEVASAIFRLTVESALNDSSTTRLLTLKTPGGKVYTQNYDGSSWGDWKQVASESEVELLTNETYNVNDTAITEVASHDILPIYDTSATGKKKIAVSNFIGGLVSNPNLLDNPWFTVNQRGQNNYIETGYTVDRWKCEDLSDSGNTLSVSDDGIVCTASGTPSKTSFLRQFFDGSVFDDSVFTLSMIIESSVAIRTYLQARTPNNTNIIDSGSVDVPANTPTIIKASANGQKINGNCYMRAFFNYSKVADAVVKIKAIKLEKGTVSTLAMDTAPNYTTELLKCQRYFNIIKSSNNTYKPIGFGYMDETTSARMAIPLSVPMRANPTIVISDLSKFRVCGEVFRNVSAMSVIDIENNIVHLSVTVSSSGTKYSPAILVDIAKDEYISFSADL